MLIRSALAFASLVMLAGSDIANDDQTGPIKILHPWARPTAEGVSTAAGYLTLTNRGLQEDRLTGVASSIASRVEVHRSAIVGGVARMTLVDEPVSIAPGEQIKFEGKAHLMFLGLHHPLKDGDRFSARLTFEQAGPMEIEFVVRKAGEEHHDIHSGH